MTDRSPSRRFIRSFPAAWRESGSQLKEHEPPRDAQRRCEQLAQRFAEFGAVGTRFLEGLLASQPVTARTRQNASLALMAAYSRQDVLAALERAVRYGAFSLAAMQRILAARSQPQTPLEALADDYRTYLEGLLGGEPTPPRPTSEYQALLGQEPTMPKRPPPREQAEIPNADTEPAEPPTPKTRNRSQGMTAPPSDDGRR